MLEKLYKLFIGHTHQWGIIREYQHRSEEGQLWSRYYCQCKVCGKIREFS